MYHSELNAQWSQSQGIDEAEFSDVLVVDSVIFASGPYGVKAQAVTGGPWEQKLFTNGSLSELHKTDSALFASNMYQLYRSKDNGNTWLRMDSEWGFTNCVKFSTCSENKLFFIIDKIYRSDDYGDTYYPVLSLPVMPFSLSYSEGSLYYICDHSYLDIEKIYESDDLGITWDSVPTTGLDPLQLAISSGICKHNGVRWISLGDISSVYRFNDSQQEWVLSCDSLYFRRMRVVDNCLYGFTFEHGLYRYDPLTESWIPENNGIETMYVTGMSCFDSTLYLATNVGAYKSSSNYDWDPDLLGLNQPAIYTTASKGNTVWTRSARGMFSSTDWGASFQYHAQGTVPIPDKMILTDTVYYFMGQNDFNKSNNQGITWKQQIEGLPGPGQGQFFADFDINSDYLFIATQQGLFRASHEDFTWLQLPALGASRVYKVIVNGPVIIVSGYINDEFQTFRSADNGDTFELMSLQLSQPSFKRGANKIYAFNFSLLYCSNDYGIAWFPIPFESSSVRCFDFEVSAAALVLSGAIYIGNATENYLSASYDNGNSWFDIRDNLSGLSNDWFFQLTKSDNRLFVVPGSYRGLWYRDDILTGIEPGKTFSHSGIVLSPNPAHDQVLVTCKGADNQTGFLTIYTATGIKVLGKKRMDLTSDGLSATVDITKLPSGIYIVNVMIGAKVVNAKMIIRK
jgi:hypothetical protein